MVFLMTHWQRMIGLILLGDVDNFKMMTNFNFDTPLSLNLKTLFIFDTQLS